MTADDVRQRLVDRVEAIEIRPDIGVVIERSARRARRRRAAAAAGALSLLAGGVGAMVVLGGGNSSAPPVVDSIQQATSTPESDVSTSAAPPTVDAVPLPDADPAEPFLAATDVVYERVLPSGAPIEVRLSEESFADFFDAEWTAPTGSAEECLGEPAVLIGRPDGVLAEGRDDLVSAWQTLYWRPIDPLTRIDLVALDASTVTIGQTYLVRTTWPVESITARGVGVTTDTAKFRDGIAVLEVEFLPEGAGLDSGGLEFTMVPMEDAQVPAEYLSFLPVDVGISDRRPTLPCSPEWMVDAQNPEGIEVIEPGAQPADPAAARRAIEERFDLLYDWTIPLDEKPVDLLDDPAGIQVRIDGLLNGANAAQVRDASVEFREVVFTAPDEAWFTYDLEAQVFFHRFGTATLRGGSWQISRATICQDLAVAGSMCETSNPLPELHPLSVDERERRRIEQNEVAWSYVEPLMCTPIRPCPDR